MLNGDALRSIDSGCDGSGADKFDGFCARVIGLVGTLGFPARLMGGGTLLEAVFAPGAGIAERSEVVAGDGFEASPMFNNAFIRASNPGVAARLKVLACPLVGESMPARDVFAPAKFNPTGRTSMLFRSGEAGESTMTVGGDVCLGVIEIIDWGLDLGGLGFRGRGSAEAGPLLLKGAKSGTSLLPDAVVGREVVTGPPGASHGERPPTTGDAGGVPLSFSRFSNLERREDTGLIEEASGLSFRPSIVTIRGSHAPQVLFAS